MGKKGKGKARGKKDSGQKPAGETQRKVFGRVRPCTCEHEFQDREYGKGMRLHTEAKTTTPGVVKYRCTVCATVKGG